MKRIDYAPGPYVSFCVECDAEFMGHMLAVRCKQCALQAGSNTGHWGGGRTPCSVEITLASGMEAGTVETEGLDAEHDSPTVEDGDAPNPDPIQYRGEM